MDPYLYQIKPDREGYVTMITLQQTIFIVARQLSSKLLFKVLNRVEKMSYTAMLFNLAVE